MQCSDFVLLCPFIFILPRYAWGANSYGQLGTGNKSNSTNPGNFWKSLKDLKNGKKYTLDITFLVRVPADSLGRITDIAATHYSHISTAVSHLTSTCYIWGQCHGQSGMCPICWIGYNLDIWNTPLIIDLLHFIALYNLVCIPRLVLSGLKIFFVAASGDEFWPDSEINRMRRWEASSRHVLKICY